MTQREYIDALTNDERKSRIDALLNVLNECDDKSSTRAKSIRRALRMHDYHIRERARRYDVRTNTIID